MAFELLTKLRVFHCDLACRMLVSCGRYSTSMDSRSFQSVPKSQIEAFEACISKLDDFKLQDCCSWSTLLFHLVPQLHTVNNLRGLSVTDIRPVDWTLVLHSQKHWHALTSLHALTTLRLLLERPLTLACMHSFTDALACMHWLKDVHISVLQRAEEAGAMDGCTMHVLPQLASMEHLPRLHLNICQVCARNLRDSFPLLNTE